VVWAGDWPVVAALCCLGMWDRSFVCGFLVARHEANRLCARLDIAHCAADKSQASNSNLRDLVKTTESIVRIHAPASKVWQALTVPGLVKQWQYGSDLLTTWIPGTQIIFRNEWNGQVFEQRGTVLEFVPVSRLRYSLFFPRPDVQDVPESYFFMTYELTESGGHTSLVFRQEDPRPSPPDASAGGDDGPDVLSSLKELVEVKMP
jgi:uncharacterized protein YndB with AHSA1/START domain